VFLSYRHISWWFSCTLVRPGPSNSRAVTELFYATSKRMKSCRSNPPRRFERSLCLIHQTSIDWQQLAHSRVEVRSKMRTLRYDHDKRRKVARATATRSKNEHKKLQKLPKRNLPTFPRSGPVPPLTDSRFPFTSQTELVVVEKEMRKSRF